MFTLIDDCYRYVLEVIKKANAGTLSRPEFTMRYNAAQLSLVRGVYEGVDADQKRMDALNILTPVPLVVANSGLQQTEGELFALPVVPNPPAGTSRGYLHLLSAALKVNKVSDGSPYPCSLVSGYLPAKITKRDERYTHDRNPYKKPRPERAWVYFAEGGLRARCGDGWFASEARIEYLRYPIEVSNIDPSNPIHPETTEAFNASVCELVARRYLEAVRDPRVQTVSKDNPLHLA